MYSIQGVIFEDIKKSWSPSKKDIIYVVFIFISTNVLTWLSFYQFLYIQFVLLFFPKKWKIEPSAIFTNISCICYDIICKVIGFGLDLVTVFQIITANMFVKVIVALMLSLNCFDSSVVDINVCRTILWVWSSFHRKKCRTRI